MQIAINYWAVLVAAIANIVIGSLWYGPIFGKPWKRLMGLTDQNVKEMKMTATQAYIGGLVTALIMAYVLAHDAAAWAGFSGMGGTLNFALQLAFWIWLGYVATTQVGSVLWEGKPWKLFILNTLQSLVSFVVMACILVFWK